jgi:hypothetical protein
MSTNTEVIKAYGSIPVLGCCVKIYINTPPQVKVDVY